MSASGPARELDRNCPKCGRVFSGSTDVCPDDGTALVDHTVRTKARDDDMVGRVLDGKYRIESVLGRGGMGVVYGAVHTMLGKRVAIKVLKVQFEEDPEILKRFTQEARAASAIGSAHIIDITDFGELEGGAAYFVMEYLDGEPLSVFMKRSGPSPADRAVSIVEQICRGLQAAHKHGIVHRDLKPDNIFLLRRDDRTDFVKILDFGIAKVAGAAGPRTRSGMVFGTPHYMAPEQAAGDPVDGRTDVYALGVILFELLVGKVPFDADSFMAILSKHMYAPAPALSSMRPDPERPAALEQIVLRAMSKKPEERQQSMDELRAALLAAVPLPTTGNLLVGSGPRPITTKSLSPMTGTGTAPPSLPGAGRGVRLALIAGIGVFAVGAGLFFSQLGSDPPPVVATPIPAGALTPPVAPPLAPAPPPTSEVPAPPPPAAEVARVHIVSTPPNAMVWSGDDELGPTPLQMDRPQAVVSLTLRAEGFEPETVQVGPDTPEPIEVALRPTPSRSAPTKGRGKAPGGDIGGARRGTQDGELRNPFGD